MGHNPFYDSLEENIRGREVRVVSKDDTAFEGWVERIHHQDLHVALRCATNVDEGERIGSALVSEVDSIEVLDEHQDQINRVRLSDIDPSPYHAAQFDVTDNREYIEQVRERGFVGSFPVVRKTGERYDVIEGHKRVWVAKKAGLESHPAEIVAIDDWVATKRFVWDHLPHESNVGEDGYYADDEIQKAIISLVEQWGSRAFDLERVAYNARRLYELQKAERVERTEDSANDSVAPEAGDDSPKQGVVATIIEFFGGDKNE